MNKHITHIKKLRCIYDNVDKLDLETAIHVIKLYHDIIDKLEV